MSPRECSERRVLRALVRAPAVHCARSEWGARTNQRLLRPPRPHPSRPLPRDPDVTGTFPPPPSPASRAEPAACGRARASSRLDRLGGRVRAQDTPPAPERALPEASPAVGPPPSPPPAQLHLPSAPVTARPAAGPESSQPPHCTTRLPNCLHSPACECMCIQRESPGGGGGGGKGEGGVHWPGSVRRTHSLTLSYPLRARLSRAHSRREPGARRIPGAAEKLVRLSFRHFLLREAHLLRGSAEPAESCSRCSGPRRPPPPLLPRLSAASTTIARLPEPVPTGIRGPEPASFPRTRGHRGPRVYRERPGAAPALPPVGAEPSSVCNLHPAGWSKSRRRRRPSCTFPRRSEDVQSRGRPGRGRDAGRSRALCYERRLAAPRSGLAAPGRPGRPGQTPAGRGRRGGRGGQVPTSLRVL